MKLKVDYTELRRLLITKRLIEQDKAIRVLSKEINVPTDTIAMIESRQTTPEDYDTIYVCELLSIINYVGADINSIIKTEPITIINDGHDRIVCFQDKNGNTMSMRITGGGGAGPISEGGGGGNNPYVQVVGRMWRLAGSNSAYGPENEPSPKRSRKTPVSKSRLREMLREKKKPNSKNPKKK